MSLLIFPCIINGISGHQTWLFFYLLEWAIVVAGGLCASYLGYVGFFWLVCIAGFISAITMITSVGAFWFRGVVFEASLGELAGLPGITWAVTLHIDGLAYSFGLLTATIGAFVCVYAFAYMRFERNILTFILYLQMFKLSMILLVWAGSWVVLILGWELIGLTSFLLINYWTSKITTLRSAFKAFSFNKVSDAALIAVACLSLWVGITGPHGGNFLRAALDGYEWCCALGCIRLNDAMFFLLCIAAFCKSAQLGFHFWLPDSMEAPVPASALIHSATLVSAGIYLILRFSESLIINSYLTSFFSLFTTATALFGATIAATQTDVKKILAYSTISHCGVLMYSITLQAPHITIFYLFAHGFFKSLNFICVGNFIQYANNYQDMSRMGGFFSIYGLERFFLIVTAFNLSSAPFFLAFFSKHWAVTAAGASSLVTLCATSMLYAAALCGFLYSARLVNECLYAHKRAHYVTYSVQHWQLTNCTYSADTYYSLLRNPRCITRVNRLGFYALIGLLISGVTLLLILWNGIIAECLTTGYGILPNSRIFTGGEWAMVWFSWVLVFIGYSYLIFNTEHRGHIILVLCAAVAGIVLALW